MVDCTKDTSRKQRSISIVRNTSKPLIPSSTATRTSSTNMDLIHHSSYSRIAVMKACKKRYHGEDMDVLCNLYHSDFDKEQMLVQLQLLGANFDVVQVDGATSIFHVKEYFLSISQGLRSLMWQVVELLQFIIVNPATNATSERSFSALRHLKSYLCTTMLQEHMNYMMLFTRKEHTL